MQIDTLKTYKSAYRSLTVALIIIVLVCFVLLGGACFLFFTKAQEGYQSVWIVDPKTGQAYKGDRVLSKQSPERKFEYENHVKMLYKNWFEFDQFTYKASIDRGLNFLGNCGKVMYNDYNTQNLQKRLSEKNIKFTIRIDSIILDMHSVPVRGVTYATQTVASPAGEIQRFMNATFTIVDLAGRSSENPHGCLIEEFNVFNQEPIKE